MSMFSSAVKSVTKGAKKVVTNPGSAIKNIGKQYLGAQTGLLTGGLVSPKTLGFNGQTANAYKYGGDAAKIGAVVAGGAALGGVGGFAGAPMWGGASGSALPNAMMAGHAATGATASAMDGVAGSSMASMLPYIKTGLAGASIAAPFLMNKQNQNPNGGNAGAPLNPANFSWNGGTNGGYTASNGGNGYSLTGNPGMMPNTFSNDSFGHSPGSPESLQLAFIQKQLQNSGITPEAQEQQRQQALQSIRSGQADRGMFNSGLGLQQESYLMPQIDQQFRQMAFNNAGQMYSQLDPMAQRNFQGNQNQLDRNQQLNMQGNQFNFTGDQNSQDRQYGLQRQFNDISSGNVNREDTQNFQSRLAYNNALMNSMGQIGNAGMNYFLK